MPVLVQAEFISRASGSQFGPEETVVFGEPNKSHGATATSSQVSSGREFNAQRPLPVAVAWFLWPTAFLALVFGYILNQLAYAAQSPPLLLFAAFVFVVGFVLKAAYISWLALDVDMLKTAIQRNGGEHAPALHFSPVWALPIVDMCACGVFLLPLSMVHLIHNRKRALQYVHAQGQRDAGWISLSEACTHPHVLIALALTWIIAGGLVLVTIVGALAVLSAPQPPPY